MNITGTILRERYEIVTELGKGGMSTVFLAKDMNLGSYWAVKKVKNSESVDIDAFKKEVELLVTLNHPDIPRIVERIEINDDYFVIMDFIDGTSLGKKVLVEGPQNEKDVIKWAKMLCEVLHYLHTAKENPIIYRDMKPDNVMLTQSGRIKLIDFGIAKECTPGEKQTGVNIGTKGYAAPEQYKGSSNVLDERTDIYSLGATLYYLVTGLTPGKPPNAIKPVRQINPIISEGLEYIISKSVNDNPDNRYQNTIDMKDDLNNIEQLTSAYRNIMLKKLVKFIISMTAFIICVILSLIGYWGVEREKEGNYQHFYKLALEAEKEGAFNEASSNYAKAIEYKTESLDTYLMYFNTLLPQIKDDDYANKTKDAIDTMRNTYLENEKSDMYHNSELLYQIAKKCIEVNDAAYASYAFEYFTILQDENFKAPDIESYKIIASNCSKNLDTQDFDTFNKELIKLENDTDVNILNADRKLENYYTLIVIYSAYPVYLNDSYNRIYEIGIKAKKIIDSNLESENLQFNNILPMYEMIASAVYNNAVTLTDDLGKEKQYKLSLEWFGYLDDLNDDLSESLWLKKANAYNGLFEIYNRQIINSNMYYSMATTYLNQSIDEYLKIIKTYNSSFLAHIYITQAYLNLELIKNNPSQQNFTLVNEYYTKVIQIKESDKNLSNLDLSKFSSLKKAMINAGLGG